MATLRKPKKRKYPKKPKASASADVMQNYLDKVKEIDKDYDAAVRAYEKEKKDRKNLRDKVKKVRR